MSRVATILSWILGKETRVFSKEQLIPIVIMSIFVLAFFFFLSHSLTFPLSPSFSVLCIKMTRYDETIIVIID